MVPPSGEATHYDVLGLDVNASTTEIKSRFRELARRYHPDVARTPDAAERFKVINEAYRILGDSGRRAAYDAELKLARLHRERSEQPTRTRPASPPRPRTEPRSPGSAPAPKSATSQARTETKRTAPHPAFKGTEVDRLILQAQIHYRRMKFREAERVCRMVLRTDRRNAVAYEILGDVQRHRGDNEQALAMYTYALQLDRANPGLRAKFERLAGSGSPSPARGAIHLQRHGSRHSNALLPERVFIDAIGIGAVAFLLVMIHQHSTVPASSEWIYEWDGASIFALAFSGFVAGLLMGLNGLLGMVREEMAFEAAGRSRRFVVPFGAVLIVCAIAWFYLAFVLYMLRSFRQEMVSRSIVRSFVASFAIVAAYALCRADAAIYFLMSGGNIVYIAFIAGWAAADGFRRE